MIHNLKASEAPFVKSRLYCINDDGMNIRILNGLSLTKSVGFASKWVEANLIRRQKAELRKKRL